MTSDLSAPIRRRFLLLGLAVLGGIGLVIGIWIWPNQPPTENLLEEARTAYAQGEFHRSRNLANQLLEASPESSDGFLIKGQAAFQLGYCTEAERALREALDRDPQNATAHREMVRLLKMEARFWELLPHALALFRLGDSGGDFLMPLAAPDQLQLSGVELEKAAHCGTTLVDDPSPLLGMARHFQNQNEPQQAHELLSQIVAKTPEQIEAQVQLGTVLLETNDSDTFVNWHEQLPKSAETHPDIWYLRGMFALSREETEIAIRCFWETIRRDPNHRRANYQLSQRLRLVRKYQLAGHFAHRFEILEEVARLVTKGDDSSSSDISPETMLRIARQMQVLGRLWEASAWYQYALKRSNGSLETDAALQDLKTQLTDDTPLTLADKNPARKAHFSHYPLPDWKPENRPPTSNDQKEVASNVVFQNVASEVGLDFRYFNGADPSSGIARMFEFSGGGVAVLDYDGDLWPDLYLTQGCAWPPGSGRVVHRDRLYRNIAGHRFEDVTIQAGLGDDQYSQGATVGDFNNDGFPDLLLANIGANRLYQNLGDGAFADVTESAGLQGEEWTSSCLVADLNYDSLPDLYCVNYLSGSDVFTRRCEQNGQPVQCPLHYFPSAQDRVFVNLGDGRFEDVTESWGVVLPNGKGLGIVAGDFEGMGRISLFIANDDTPNFFLAPKPKFGTGSFLDRAVLSGVAFGDFGTAQSCMGVAAGDANNDGLLDLYVTNFTNEHNNLFLRQESGGFSDQARTAGLHWATMREMGWGTQFLDGELDGFLDLIVANGHLDENTSGRFPYKMHAQYFRNWGDNRFSQLTAKQLGSYFQHPHAGRAIARLDWNRDGRDDCCVTHVDEPIALLSNQTPHVGNRLVLRLKGVQSNRDAIGSIIRINAGNKTFVRHLTAGDGFQASNERKVIVGIGSLEHIDAAIIQWPSRTEQKLTAPELNRETLVIENQGPIKLP